MQITAKGLEARKKYNREQYAKKKELGLLPLDRYTAAQRRKYNREYQKMMKSMNAYWNKKGEMAEEGSRTDA